MTKALIAVLQGTVMCLATCAFGVELDLAGDWTLSGSNEVGQAISCPIAVPGDVHSALLKAKLMPDPFWGCNETNVQWIGRTAVTLLLDRIANPALPSREVFLGAGLEVRKSTCR